MMTYVACMCVALPVALLPVWILQQTRAMDPCQSQDWSLRVAQSCARGLLHIMPFVRYEVVTTSLEDNDATADPEPSIWVANHVSPLDTFLFLALDRDLRGSRKRPLKTIYVRAYVLVAAAVTCVFVSFQSLSHTILQISSGRAWNRIP